MLSITIILAMSACSSKKEERPLDRANDPTMRRLHTMKKALNLSDEQMAKIEKIFENSREKVMDARKQAERDRSKMMELMFKMREENDQKIEALLNDKQKEKFEAYKKQRDERMKERMNRRNGM